MKTIITTVALASTLLAGAALADTVNHELGQFDQGTAIATGSHYISEETVNIDSANLPANMLNSDIYIGGN